MKKTKYDFGDLWSFVSVSTLFLIGLVFSPIIRYISFAGVIFILFTFGIAKLIHLYLNRK